jgi:peptidoglycan/xylan/chitin deacetylase (PgdA/CDA1 family)
MRNCLTIDLESIAHRYLTEWRYLSEAGKRLVKTEENRRALDAGYLPLSTRRVLHALRNSGQTATFFVVGEINDWYPTLTREIKELGHEVAYHSHSHIPLGTVDSLRKELRKSRKFLDDFRPIGFRAPRASITEKCLTELASHGFVYDSSSYGPYYSSGRFDGILEVPISTYSVRDDVTLTLPRHMSLRLLRNLEIPFGSGYFISLLSLLNPALVSYLIHKANKRGDTAVLCLHPWQLFSRPTDSLLEMNFFRFGLFPYEVSCNRAFEHLLRKHKFCSVSELIEATS